MAGSNLHAELSALAPYVKGTTLAFGPDIGLPIPGAYWTPWDYGADTTAEVLPTAGDRSVDGIVAVFALEESRNPTACLREWRRVLREGGRLAIVLHTPSAAPPAHQRHEFALVHLVELMNWVGGFNVAEARDVTPGVSWLLVAERRTVAEVHAPLAALTDQLVAMANRNPQAHADLYSQFGKLLLRTGDSGLAETCFRRAQALAGEDPEVMFGLGMSYGGQGRWGEALAELQKVVDLVPEDPEALRWIEIACHRRQSSAVLSPREAEDTAGA